MSSTRRSASKSAKQVSAAFSLKDLDNAVSTPSAKKALKDTPSSSLMLTNTRSKAVVKRKRGSDELEDLEKQFHTKMAEGMALVRSYYEGVNSNFEQEISKAKASIALKDQLIKEQQKDLDNAAKEIATKDAYAKEQINEIIQSAKASAHKVILEARIKMAEEAANPDFDKSTWDLEGWKKAFADMVDGEDDEVEAGSGEVKAVEGDDMEQDKAVEMEAGAMVAVEK